MDPNQLVLQRLTDSLSQLHTEMVRVRELTMKRWAHEWEAVDESQNAIGTGGSIIPVVLNTAPIRVDSILVYTSSNNSTLQIKPGEFAIPIPQGVTFLSQLSIIFQGSQRPKLSDPSSTANLYIRVCGYAIPPRSMPM